MNYLETLLKINLTLAEAKIYNALLSLIQATPSELAKETNLTRASAYQILSKLEKLELVSKVKNSHKLKYHINTPDRLMDLLHNSENKLAENKNDLKKFINSTSKKVDLSYSKPIVRYYQDIDSIQELFLTFLEDIPNGDTLYGILNRTMNPEFIIWMNKIFVKERVDRNIFLKLIVTNEDSKEQLKSTDKLEKRETKLFESRNFPKGTYICISKTKVFLLNINAKKSENMGILIEQPFITEAIKALFDLIWES